MLIKSMIECRQKGKQQNNYSLSVRLIKISLHEKRHQTQSKNKTTNEEYQWLYRLLCEDFGENQSLRPRRISE
jgi:hypothetical protein